MHRVTQSFVFLHYEDHDYRNCLSYRGGLAAYNERLARQFVDEGHDVTIVTFKLQYPGFLFPGKSQFIDGPAPEGLKIIRRVNSVNPFNWLSVGYMVKKKDPIY